MPCPAARAPGFSLSRARAGTVATPDTCSAAPRAEASGLRVVVPRHKWQVAGLLLRRGAWTGCGCVQACTAEHASASCISCCTITYQHSEANWNSLDLVTCVLEPAGRLQVIIAASITDIYFWSGHSSANSSHTRLLSTIWPPLRTILAGHAWQTMQSQT